MRLMIVNCPLAPKEHKMFDYSTYRVCCLVQYELRVIWQRCVNTVIVWSMEVLFSFSSAEGFWTAEDVWLTFPIADLGAMNGRDRNLKHGFFSNLACHAMEKCADGVCSFLCYLVSQLGRLLVSYWVCFVCLFVCLFVCFFVYLFIIDGW